METMLRYWFKNSAFYGQGPYTLVGILATSWEDANAKACGPTAVPEIAKLLCIGPQYYFLSCNVDRLDGNLNGPQPDTDNGALFVTKESK